jgi:hypothetical protein
MTCDNENGDLEELRRMDACTNCTRLSVEIAQLCEDKLTIAAERDKWHFEYDNLAKFATQYERERDVARGDRDDLCELLKAAEARAEEWEAKATLYAASLDKGGWDDLARDLREKLTAAEARAEEAAKERDFFDAERQREIEERYEIQAERDRLAEALRNLAIVGMDHGDSMLCQCCDSSWGADEKERHENDCPLASPTPSPHTCDSEDTAAKNECQMPTEEHAPEEK